MLRRKTTLLFALILCGFVATSHSTLAQQNGGGGGGDDGVIIGQPIAGVEVDAAGVLRVRQFDPRVTIAKMRAARQQLPQDLATGSPLRKISLNRLEAAVAARLGASQRLDDEMLALAGLTRVEYVFFYPETGDIVLAGPAEGFTADEGGRVRGIQTGAPVLLLEDLIVALRAFPAHGEATDVISVSIDPTQEGLARMQQFLARVGRQATRGATAAIAGGLKQNLGLQNVTIHGVPAETHFAQVLVEADYRMKLIGIGLEELPVPLKSYVERANPRTVATNAMERWFFVPDYDRVRVGEDGMAMRLEGNGVKLVGAAETVTGRGERVGAGRRNPASEAFCEEFTEKYQKIAAAVPVYAQLRNLIDLSIAAAYIHKQDFYRQANWDMEVFSDETRLPVANRTAPHQVETAVNAIWRGNTLMTPLGGGIQFQPLVSLNRDRVRPDETGQADQLRQQQPLADLKPGQWWWD